jgi:hypothetical protein
MAANLLEFDHHVSQIFVLNFLSSSLMRDGPILAEDAPKIAVGEENSAGPISAYQRHLLAEVGVITENYGLHRSPAEPLFTF